MKKLKQIAVLLTAALCVGTAALGLSACGEEDVVVETAGSSTTLKTDKAPSELTPYEVAYAFLEKQSGLKSYMITTEGAAVADLAGYRQEIHNTTYKNGEDYLNQAESTSFLVNMKHQAFAKGDKIVYRNAFDGEMSVADSGVYKTVYGVSPADVALGGYIVNAKTLRFAEQETSAGGTLTYRFLLAGDLSVDSGAASESAASGVRLQAEAYGGLDYTPKFSDIDIRLTIKDDWTPVRYTVSCSYTCKKVFSMNIEQTLTCTYSKVNEAVEIPSVQEFNGALGTTPSPVGPAQSETTPLMQLAEAFSASYGEDGIHLGVEFSSNAFALPVDLKGTLDLKVREALLREGDYLNAFALRLDLDLSALPVLPSVANTLTLRYLGEGELFLMLNRKDGSGDHFLYTYSLNFGEALGALKDFELNAEQISKVFSDYIDLQVTEKGYSLSLKPNALAQLNASYQDMLANLKTEAPDFAGLVSLFGSEFTSLSLDLSGRDKITAAAGKLEGVHQKAEIEYGGFERLVKTLQKTMEEEQGSVALSLGLSVFDEEYTLGGGLEWSYDREAVAAGDRSGLSVRFSLDLGGAPLISALVGSANFGLRGEQLYFELCGPDGSTLFGASRDLGVLFGLFDRLGLWELDGDLLVEALSPQLNGLYEMLGAYLTVREGESGVAVMLNETARSLIDQAYEEYLAQLEAQQGLPEGSLYEAFGMQLGSFSCLISEQDGKITALKALAQVDFTGNYFDVDFGALEGVVGAVKGAFAGPVAEIDFGVDVVAGEAYAGLDGHFALQIDYEKVGMGDYTGITCEAVIALDSMLGSFIQDIAVVLDGTYLTFSATVAGQDYTFELPADGLYAALGLLGQFGSLPVDPAAQQINMLFLRLNEMLSVEETAQGYLVTVNPDYVELLGYYFEQFIDSLTGRFGENGVIESLFNYTLGGISFELAGKDVLTEARALVELDYEGNVNEGRHHELELDLGLFSRSEIGLLTGPFTGDLYVHLHPEMIWSNNWWELADFRFELDLSPAQMLLALLGSFVPDALPSYLGKLDSLTVYYAGEGIACLALYDADGLPVLAKEIDLIALIKGMFPSEPAAMALAEEEEGPSFSLSQLFTFELTEKGLTVKFGETAVAAVDMIYQQLVETVVQMVIDSATESGMGSMADLAGMLIRGWLGASVTEIELFAGIDDDYRDTLSLEIRGIPQTSPHEDGTPTSLLLIRDTSKGALTEEEREELHADRQKALKLLADAATALGYEERIAELVAQPMDFVTNGGEPNAYYLGILSLHDEVFELSAEVRSLIPNLSYLEEIEEFSAPALCVTYSLYLARVRMFEGILSKESDLQKLSDEDWDTLKDLYEKADTSYQALYGIVVPAVGECEDMLAYLGEKAENYLKEREIYEQRKAEELQAAIHAAAEKFASAQTTREELTDALTEFAKDLKPAYDKLPAEKQALVTEYQTYLSEVYFKNIAGAKEEYDQVKEKLTELLAQPGQATIGQLLGLMHDLSKAYAWGFGKDYWETNTETDVMPWGSSWMNSLRPANVSAEQQQMINDLNAVNRELIRSGETAKSVATVLKQLIHDEVAEKKELLFGCRKVVSGQADEWDFSSIEPMEEQAKKELLEELHGLRYLIAKVLPTAEGNAIWDDDDLKTFATNLSKWETAFAAYLEDDASDDRLA